MNYTDELIELLHLQINDLRHERALLQTENRKLKRQLRQYTGGSVDDDED